MGWARTFLLGDIGNQMDIQDMKRNMRRQRRRSAQRNASAKNKQVEILKSLESDNAELKLLLASLVRLLVAKKQITADELRKMVDAVDASDGEADGRFDGQVI